MPEKPELITMPHLQNKAFGGQVADVHTILNSVAEILIIIDTKGKILFLNKHTQQFQHLIKAPLRPGSQIFNSIPLSWHALANNILNNLNNGNQPAIVEARYADAEGKDFYFEIRCSAIPDARDIVTQIFIEARDVTPQKIFENKITIFAREYQSLIENANAVIIGTDTRGYITEWNEMASEITGYSKNESYTQKLLNLLLEPESQANFSQAMENVLRGDVVTNYEVTILAKNQRKLTFLINATPRKSLTAEVVGILLIGQDITELSDYRKSLEQKVQERTEALQSALQKEKELVEIKNRFVSIASHEFRSPLSSIDSSVDFMKTYLKKLTPAEALIKLDNIQTQVKHMAVLLEDVLTIGKSEAGKMKANIGLVELNGFFHRIIDEVQGNTNNSHCIRFNFPAAALEIKSDEKLLRNIFINLLNNAIKFSPGEKEVFLTVAINDPVVTITIQDKGIGIDEKDIERVFQPFNRGSNAQEIKGTGLGLSIVKKAVETLGGKLYVQSKIKEGTLFTVKLNLNRNL